MKNPLHNHGLEIAFVFMALMLILVTMIPEQPTEPKQKTFKEHSGVFEGSEIDSVGENNVFYESYSPITDRRKDHCGLIR